MTLGRPTPGRRRGAAAVAMIVLLLVVGMVVTGVVIGGARDHDLTVRRLETVQAFYAAEAGMNMAMRELHEKTDADGDGTVGSISDDANDANDPAIGAARVVVVRSDGGGVTSLISTGRQGAALREIRATLE